MATMRDKIEAEVRIRQLLEGNGLPEPDAVEYGYTCVRLFWEEQKVVLVIDLDELEADQALDAAEVDELLDGPS